MNKRLLVLQASLMYVVHIPFYILLILLFAVPTDQLSENVVIFLVVLGLVLQSFLTPLCIGSIITSIFKAKNPEKDIISLVMKIKLILIPWYAFNLVLAFISIAGFLNPFLLIAIPIILFFEACFTYLYMITTTVPGFVNVIRLYKINHQPIGGFNIFLLVCYCIFGIDVIAAIILNYRVKKNTNLIDGTK